MKTFKYHKKKGRCVQCGKQLNYFHEHFDWEGCKRGETYCRDCFLKQIEFWEANDLEVGDGD